jgi:hypothetical protein
MRLTPGWCPPPGGSSGRARQYCPPPGLCLGSLWAPSAWALQQLGPAAALALPGCLQANQSLTTLLLRDNPLGQAGARRLLRAVHDKAGMDRLDLLGCTCVGAGTARTGPCGGARPPPRGPSLAVCMASDDKPSAGRWAVHDELGLALWGLALWGVHPSTSSGVTSAGRRFQSTAALPGDGGVSPSPMFNPNEPGGCTA